jgi:hypothetical protein
LAGVGVWNRISVLFFDDPKKGPTEDKNGSGVEGDFSQAVWSHLYGIG